MASTGAVLIVDKRNRIVAAQLNGAKGAERATRGAPAIGIVPLPGQRAFFVTLPRAVLAMGGADLDRYFARVKVAGGKLRLPKVESGSSARG